MHKMLAFFRVNAFDFDYEIACIVFCEFCGDAADVEYEDHTARNCWCWCPSCGTMILCMSSQLYDEQNNDFDDLYDGLSTKCAQKITHEEAKLYMQSKGLSMQTLDYHRSNGLKQDVSSPIIFPGKHEFQAEYCYLIGVINIKALWHGYDSDYSADEDYEEPARTPVNIIRLKDAPFDATHDGVQLNYYGECTQCGCVYDSWICGD